jgi:hypothetical protein
VAELRGVALGIGNQDQPVVRVISPVFTCAIGKCGGDHTALIITRQPRGVALRIRFRNNIGALVMRIGFAIAKAVNDNIQFAIITPAINGSAPSKTRQLPPPKTGATAPAPPSSASPTAKPTQRSAQAEVPSNPARLRVSDTPSKFFVGDRVFHIKFGNGNVTGIEGNKLTIQFDKAGEKRVLDGFVTGV